jgi:3-oxoacyl-[acyl-carrier-protein] synthase I
MIMQSMPALAIVGSGMVTGVGFDAPSSCAAIRCAIDNFTETRFVDRAGEWIVGSQVQLEHPWRGLDKLVHMIVPAIRECLVQARGVPPNSIPLLLCVAERDRPGRLDGLEDDLFRRILVQLGTEFHSHSAIVPLGRVGGAVAMGRASQLLYTEQVPLCLIAGVDSLLVGASLSAFEGRERLLTSKNSNGFIPGEGAAAILVARPQRSGEPELVCLGMGRGQESATIESDKPLRADGLVEALKNTIANAGRTLGSADYRITDSNGEQYWFKEAALAVTRILRERKENYFIWHAADCIGETGAGAGPAALAVALAAARKGYAPGPGVLCHFGSDDGTRVAMMLAYEGSSAG